MALLAFLIIAMIDEFAASALSASQEITPRDTGALEVEEAHRVR